jgi:hypothetical protein
MIGRLQQLFSAINGGLVLANGMTGGPPNAADPFNLAVLDHVDGVENEHFAVFEQVRHRCLRIHNEQEAV